MKKKSHIFLSTLMLALSLLLLISSTAWAKDPSQLDYADIGLRVPKENKQLDIQQRRLPLLQKARDEMANLRDNSAGASEAVARLSQSFYTIARNPDADPGQRAWATLMISSLSMGQGSGTSISFSGIDLQIEQMRIQITQTQAQIINNGQQLFFRCHQLQDRIKKTKDDRVLLEEKLKLAQTQQTAGTGTALQVKEVELALAELDTGVKQMESQCAQWLNQLKLIVGWPQIQIIKLGSIPRPNREYLGKIVLADDIQSACDNSYSLKLSQAEYRYTDSDEQKSIIKLAIEAQKEQISLAVSTQHYVLTDTNNSLLLEEQRLALAEQRIKQSRLQNQIGLLADIALQAEENNYKTQQETVITAMDSLFWEIEKYKSIVAGLN